MWNNRVRPGPSSSSSLLEAATVVADGCTTLYTRQRKPKDEGEEEKASTNKKRKVKKKKERKRKRIKNK